MKSLREIKKTLATNKNELRKRYKIKEIGIFGSFVRGEYHNKSDIDILVDFYEVPDFIKFIEIETFLEKILGVKVDLVRKPVLRTELKDKILSEVILI